MVADITQQPDLEFLRSLTEQELSELVLIPLLEALEYRDIRYTHGILEYGKDIVCAKEEPLDGHVYIGFAVKVNKITGSVSSSRSIRELLYQIEQALSSPFISPFDGSEVYLKKAYVVTNQDISQLAIKSIKDDLGQRAHAINFIDGPRLLDLIREHIPSLLSNNTDPAKMYIMGLRQRFIRLSAPSMLGSERYISLPEIYSGGILSSTTPEDAQFISFASLEASQDVVYIKGVLQEHNNVVILADVGAGKTTFLKKLTLDIIDTSEHGSGTTIPVFIELSSIPASALKSYERFVGWLNNSAQSATNSIVQDIASYESITLLLDGFDEIPRGHDLAQKYISQFCSDYSGLVILTSRPSRISLLSESFSYYRLNPLTDGEIEYFINKWFGTDIKKAESLYKHIKNDQTLLQFCRTPLLLTLYSVLAGSEPLDELPNRKSEIYEALATLLLGKWDSMRGVVNYFNAGTKAFCIERLALQMQTRSVKTFHPSEVDKIEKETTKKEKAKPGHASPRLFDELIFRSSLLRRLENDRYSFSHFSLQEYFAAKQLFRMGDARFVQRIIYSEWWKNCLLFYFGIARTLDGVRISGKRATDKAYYLLEYLAEADYTSREQADGIYSIVGAQLLEETRPTTSLINAGRKLRSDLVPAMNKLIDGSKSEKGIFSFYSIMFEFGAEGTGAALINKGLLRNLSVGPIGSLCKKCAEMASIADDYKVLAELYKQLEEREKIDVRKYPQTEKREVAAMIRSYISATIKAVGKWDGIEGKDKNLMIERFKKINNRFASNW